MLGDKCFDSSVTFYLLLVVLQLPEFLGTGAQLDEKTTSGDPLDRNREYFQLKLSFCFHCLILHRKAIVKKAQIG